MSVSRKYPYCQLCVSGVRTPPLQSPCHVPPDTFNSWARSPLGVAEEGPSGALSTQLHQLLLPWQSEPPAGAEPVLSRSTVAKPAATSSARNEEGRACRRQVPVSATTPSRLLFVRTVQIATLFFFFFFFLQSTWEYGQLDSKCPGHAQLSDTGTFFL